jgi:hypothetical protein
MLEPISTRNTKPEIAAQRARCDTSTGRTPVRELVAKEPTQTAFIDRGRLDRLTVRPLMEEAAENASALRSRTRSKALRLRQVLIKAAKFGFDAI